MLSRMYHDRLITSYCCWATGSYSVRRALAVIHWLLEDIAVSLRVRRNTAINFIDAEPVRYMMLVL